MKTILLMLFVMFPFTMVSQNIDLTSYEGIWKWHDSATDSELIINIKRVNYNWPQMMGGQLDSALVGGYKYKKNGKVLVDNLQEFYTNKYPFDYPIRISSILSLGVHDYLTTNGRGEYKYLSGQSKIMIVSESNPMQIRWIINDNSEQVVVVFDNEDPDQYIFPKGTALPTDIILTKVE